MKGISTRDYEGIQLVKPSKSQIVHAVDFDDTITIKPTGFDNTGMSKNEFFDAARNFTPNQAIVDLIKLWHRHGDAVAVCTARPTDRLIETIEWLKMYRIPVDCILLSKGTDVSGNTKQKMLKYLHKRYKFCATLVDDSPYNIEGARLQGTGRIHVLTNCAYWDAHPEVVTKQ